MVEYEIINDNAANYLRKLEAGRFDTCITSPPYFGLRDYGVPGQIGLEKTPEEYVKKLVKICREVRRVLRDDGTLWLNLGDSYAGSMGRWGGVKGMSGKQASNAGSKALAGKPQKWEHPIIKPKDLIGIPWRVALALQADGWYLRQDIIWSKPNPMPESIRDRCTKSHEYIFLLSKQSRYYYDSDAIKEASKIDGERVNKRDVWAIPVRGFKGAHFATFPPELIRPCVLAGSRRGGEVLDPFAGSGTTIYTAVQEGRNATGIEINPEYAELAKQTVGAKTSQLNLMQCTACTQERYYGGAIEMRE